MCHRPRASVLFACTYMYIPSHCTCYVFFLLYRLIRSYASATSPAACTISPCWESIPNWWMYWKYVTNFEFNTHVFQIHYLVSTQISSVNIQSLYCIKSSLILHYNSPECSALSACKQYKQQFAQVHNNINNTITLLDNL